MHIRHDLEIFIPAQGGGGVTGVHQSFTLWPCSFGFSGAFPLWHPSSWLCWLFFCFDNPLSAHSSSRTGTRITEVFTRRSHLIMFLPQNSDAATRLNLLSTQLWHSPHSSTKQVLTIKGCESGVLISGCATKEVKLRQEQICLYVGIRCSFACSTTLKTRGCHPGNLVICKLSRVTIGGHETARRVCVQHIGIICTYLISSETIPCHRKVEFGNFKKP